jgi:hypothetical protein
LSPALSLGVFPQLTFAGGVNANYIARWTGQRWSALGSGANFYVYSLVAAGSDLYVGGEFTVAGGKPSMYLAAWRASGPNAVRFDDTAVADDVPVDYALFQNHPNPFNPTTTIRYRPQVESNVQIKIYDLLGQCVRTVVAENQPGGNHMVLWDSTNDAGSPVASGVYFCRFEATSSVIRRGTFERVQKMVILR